MSRVSSSSYVKDSLMLASCNGLSKAKQNEARDLELWSPSRLYYLVRYLGKGTYLSWEAHVNNVPSRPVTSHGRRLPAAVQVSVSVDDLLLVGIYG